MDLQAYFDRIGFTGAPRADFATLAKLHRAHLESIPYENLDVQLGRRVGLEPAAIFDKLVTRRRGGWCYEMNGLLGWALDEIGFSVTRLAGAVMREAIGARAIANHLVLLVDMDGPVIADVGFGDGAVEPFRLREGAFTQYGFGYRLELRADGWWRFHNHAEGGAPYFDFQLASADPLALAARCEALQTDPASPFVANAILQRRFADRVEAMVNSERRVVRSDDVESFDISDVDEYRSTLLGVFGLDLPEAVALWPRLAGRTAPGRAQR
jgi:N-hydroxyarylamine O-acetyltransferase